MTPRRGYAEAPYHTEKIEYQINRSHRLVGFYQYLMSYRRPFPARLLALESRSGQDQNGRTAKVQWQGFFGQSTVAEFQWGMWSWLQRAFNDTDNVTTNDIVTQ